MGCPGLSTAMRKVALSPWTGLNSIPESANVPRAKRKLDRRKFIYLTTFRIALSQGQDRSRASGGKTSASSLVQKLKEPLLSWRAERFSTVAVEVWKCGTNRDRRA